MLSTFATIYDPLSLIGPIIVTAKTLMQRICQLKIGWDDQLPTKIINDWQTHQRVPKRASTYTKYYNSETNNWI